MKRIEHERIAAALDGRLTEEEKAKLFDELSSSPEDLALYADVIAMLRDVESAKEPPAPSTLPGTRSGSSGGSVVPISGQIDTPGIIPIPIPPPDAPPQPPTIVARRRRWVVPTAIAAGIIGVVSISLIRKGMPEPGVFDPGSEALSMATAAYAGPGWSTARGSGANSGGSDVRLGARLTDLDALIAAGDTSVATVALEIGAMFATMPGGSVVESALRALADAPRDTSRIAASRSAIAASSPTADRKAGAWLERIRLSASAGGAGLDRAAAVRALRSIRGPSESTEDEARALAADLDSTSPAWASIGSRAQTLLVTLADR